MGFKSRKFYIWLISMGAVLGIYLLYGRISKTPDIVIDTTEEPTAQSESVDESGEQMGTVGNVEVGDVQKARYVHLNSRKQIDRVFGFEKLLRKEGNYWEIEGPYMNVFRDNFKCRITADKGKVQVESAAGKINPKDAALSGNVVIHIIPENSDVMESFIYLDDIVFISEMTQFSSPGPVRFVSEDAQMSGRGLKLIYNNLLNRLEFLRINHLDSLRLRNSEMTSLSSDKADAPDTDQAETKPGAKPTAEATGEKIVEQDEGKSYRCVFYDNVIIDSPEQLIFADEISINNIFFSKSSKPEPDKTADVDLQGDIVTDHSTTSKTGVFDTDNAAPRSYEMASTKQTGSHKSDERLSDIVVTCNNGIMAAPMDSPLRKLQSPANRSTGAGGKSPGDFNDTIGRTVFTAKKINYNASTGRTVGAGPTELTFYAKDIAGPETKQTVVPVKVTTRKTASFSPALNQVVFEGDCLCTMLREETEVQHKYTLSAPKLIVDLSEKANKAGEASMPAVDIRHLTAEGGVVKLATVKTSQEKLIGGTELKCNKFEYDTSRKRFLATGPGLIKVDNSKAPETKTDTGRFSLQRQCYAVIRNFHTLDYSLLSNQIIAEAAEQRVLIDYFPIIDGQYGQPVSATANRIEALLSKGSEGGNELSTLNTTGGISYEEEGIQFEGKKLFYDAASSIMTVRGDELQPCLLNGAFVDEIEYNVETGELKGAKIKSPGTMQMKR